MFLNTFIIMTRILNQITLLLRKGKCEFTSINSVLKDSTFYANGKLTKSVFISVQTHEFRTGMFYCCLIHRD